MSAVKKLKQEEDVTSVVLTDWDQFMTASPAPEWVKALRIRAHDKIGQNDVPTSKGERYKYTNINAAVKNKTLSFDAANVATVGPMQYVKKITDLWDAPPAWFKEAAESAPAGEAMYQDMLLWDATNAYFRDGLVIDVPQNTSVEDALEITQHNGADHYVVPRTFIRVGANSQLTIIERHTGDGSYWKNRVSQIFVEKGGRLRHYRIQDDTIKAVYTQNTHVKLAQDATYEACVLTTGAELSRNQIHVELQGPGAEVYLSGLNLLSGTQHGDTTITIEHQAPHCHSNQLYKTIVDDKAHCVFQGKVHVHQIAQKTDGYQLSNALILSPTAIMDTKPELEIYADDVKCSHGSTTGQIDEAPLFYLRTRGLSEAQARMLLMQAFLGPVLDNIRDEKVQELFSELAVAWLETQTGKK